MALIWLAKNGPAVFTRLLRLVHGSIRASEQGIGCGGVMWVGRNGARWRAIPAEYGNWNTIHRRFRRWSRKGVWQIIFNTLAVSADTEWLMIDSTIVRAHQHAAGAKGGSKMKR